MEIFDNLKIMQDLILQSAEYQEWRAEVYTTCQVHWSCN